MSEKHSTHKVALMMAPGLEEIEGLTVADLLYRAGVSCELISVGEGLEVVSSHKVKIVCDQHVDDVNFDDFDMIVLPGGIPGTPNLKACEKLMDGVKRFAEQEKPIGAICAAPSILAELGLLKGRNATSNPAFMQVLEEHGALTSEDNVVVDGPFITSRAMGTAIAFGIAIVARLCGTEEAVKLAQTILWIDA
ncbi:MAG: DJ-1/PfpI family protein [Atopobiaceae bacterium]|nr:DJ-1/PfpI family protein [Atopobiaceae bacterium]